MGRLFKPANLAVGSLAALIVIGAAAAAGYAYLPHCLQDRLLPKLAADLGFRKFNISVRRVGLWGADLAAVRIGTPSQAPVELDAVQLDYSPGGLMRRTVDRVAIVGLRIGLAIENGRLVLDESLAAVLNPESRGNGDPSAGRPGKLPFHRLVVKDAQLALRANGRTFLIPFELTLTPDGGGRTGRMAIEAAFRPRDQHLAVAVEADFGAGAVHARLKADALQLNAFADVIEAYEVLGLNGVVGIDGTAELSLDPLKISSADATFRWQGNGIDVGPLRFKPDTPDGAVRPPWQFTVGTTDGSHWRVTAAPLLLESALVMRLSGLDATASRSAGGLQVEGTLRAEPLGMQIRGLSLTQAPMLTGSFDAEILRNRKWRFSFVGAPAKRKLELQMAANRLLSTVGGVEVNASADAERLSADVSASLSGLRVQTASLKASAAAISLKAALTAPAAAPDNRRAEVSVTLSNAGGESEGVQFSGAGAAFSGTLRTAVSGAPRMGGTLRFSAAKLVAPAAAVELNGAAGRLPLSWPPPEKTGTAGEVSIASARFQKWTLSKITGTLRQTDSGVSVTGRHADAVIPDLAVDYHAASRLVGRGAPSVTVRVTADRPETAPPIDLGAVLPGGRGMVLGGRLEASADLQLDAGGVNGTSAFRLTDGLLQASKEKFEVSGIQLRLEMPGLPALRSAPGQQLRFASANLGDIQLKEGIILFQIEPAPALLLEKGQFDWVEGRVDMHSTRISLDREDYGLTLFCDRLNLARLLEQFGAADAEGTGTVSGKIPIRYRDGQWTVADGFLFSSPGAGGQIRLQGTEFLTAGIPADSPQYMQMEIAREALKDYDYSWAKLTVTTEGEDMLLKLQLDGKPATTLPFVFHKEIGKFARVAGQSQGSTFQGIRLDVNFRLPLNKILQYKSIIQMIRTKGAK